MAFTIFSFSVHLIQKDAIPPFSGLCTIHIHALQPTMHAIHLTATMKQAMPAVHVIGIC